MCKLVHDGYRGLLCLSLLYYGSLSIDAEVSLPPVSFFCFNSISSIMDYYFFLWFDQYFRYLQGY